MAHATHLPVPRRRAGWSIAAAIIALLLVAAVVSALHTVDDAPNATVDAGGAAAPVVTAPDDVRAYAQSHGLIGLSPAGLTQPDGDELALYAAYRDIARYAQANGMHGLSPAGMTPVARNATVRRDGDSR